MRRTRFASLSALLLVACGGAGESVEAGNGGIGAPSATGQAESGRPFNVTPVADFEHPWAMTFIPGTDQALVTEKAGSLKLLTLATGEQADVAGVPPVAFGGQGGLGDVVLHPDFANNRLVYLSWAEAGEGNTAGAAVGRARLVTEGGQPRLEGLQVIWRQEPKVTGQGHYSHRIAFDPDGVHMFITSGDRQKFDPAQDRNANLGRVIRLTDTGGIPSDNPWYDQGRLIAQAWTMGNRNLLGIAFAPDGRLWAHEMGPKGGDEFNLIEKGANYGYPIVSDGDHYDGRDIPDHSTRPEFKAPVISWTPVISPAGLIFYTGTLFPDWQGDALIGGLSSKALVRVEVNGTQAREVARYDMGARIREVEQGPDGAVYLLEDGGESQGRLLKLTPAE